MWFRGIINIQYEFSFPFEELWQVDLRWRHSNVTAAHRAAEDSDVLIKNLTRLGVGFLCQGWNAGYLCLCSFSLYIFFLWVCLSLVPLITSLRHQRSWLMMEINLLVLGGASFYSVKHVLSVSYNLVHFTFSQCEWVYFSGYTPTHTLTDSFSIAYNNSHHPAIN